MKRKTKKRKISLKYSLLHLFHPRKSNQHRAKILHPSAYLYFCLIVIVAFSVLKIINIFPQLKEKVLGYASNITSHQVHEETNRERVKLGLKPLVINEKLNQAALAKAQDMFNQQYWSHNSPSGKEPWFFIQEADYVYQIAGENLARDFANTPDLIAAWMASPSHKANIINPKYQDIGIAVVNGNLQGFETTLVVQLFGKKKESGLATISEFGQQVEESIPVIAREEKKSGSAAILAGALIPSGSLINAPLLSPLQLTKAFFLSIIILITLTLLYDWLVMGHRQINRFVGHNLAHIILFTSVAFLLIFFKSGMIN